MIQNLIINAAQAMPTGGTTEVTGENPVQTTSNQILDDGELCQNMHSRSWHRHSSELCRRIFDPYFTTKQEGSGLGLAITHSIIARHNGHIRWESIPGRFGFHILLPATKGLPPSRSEQIAAVPGNSGSRIPGHG